MGELVQGRAEVTPNFIIGISFVGGLEYTRRALDSLGRYKRNVVIIDCAEPGPTNFGTALMSKDAPTIIRPTVPLSHTQAVNAICSYARYRKHLWYLQMHNDAEASEGAVDALVQRVTTEREKWAIMFTNYDCLAAYSMDAADVVGPWDWRLFPSYYSDNDYHRRCLLAGYQLMDTGIQVKHVGSHIINKVDKRLKFLTRVQFDHWAAIYCEKWGDHPGKETFTKPFNGVLENPYPDE